MLTNAVMSTVLAGAMTLLCENPGSWRFETSVASPEKDVEVVRIRLVSEVEAVPPKFSVGWNLKATGVANLWSSANECRLPPDWSGSLSSTIASQLPVYALMGADDTNRCTFATTEARNHTEFRTGVREETVEFPGRFTYFNATPTKAWTTEIRIDRRPRHFAETIADASAWISRLFPPCRVPEAAFEPLYSTWYNFHQDVHDRDIERECAEAAKLGMRTLIVDDGWQTDDTRRGYAFCGDWEVSRRRFPDMAAHVKRVHALGLKYMVWYSVPFVGARAKNFARFRGKYLRGDDLSGQGEAVLDPRYPEVRRFLVGIYEKAMREWDIDGFKLDFIDSFNVGDDDPGKAKNYAGMDTKSVPEAVDLLMKEVHAALTAIKPDALFEFRQRYIGPAIRQYGNMLRASDCPYDATANRVRTTQLRLTSGGTAVHSDMLEWHDDDTTEFAALQILGVLFSTIQYSRTLSTMKPEHKAMVAHWLKFTREHRETLLRGRFTPHQPMFRYPVLEAESAAERIVAVYAPTAVADLRRSAKKTIVINATTGTGVAVRGGEGLQWTVFDMYGSPVPGLSPEDIPPAGYATVGARAGLPRD